MRLAWTVRRNSYFDSIDLMRVAEQARQLAGVTEVGVVMGTAPGRSMLAEAGMWPPEAPEAGPSDLLICVRASTETVAHRALARVEELLSASRDGEPAREDVVSRTTASAARRAASANIAVVAVPGAYAAIDAHQALSAGLHVFLFSDGISLADEAALSVARVPAASWSWGRSAGRRSSTAWALDSRTGFAAGPSASSEPREPVSRR